jgi:hypothetical protein
VSRRGLARLNAKRDANERAIIQTLEARGYSVAQVSGKGVPDLLVGRGGRQVWLVEAKAQKGTLTPAQVKWREKWTGPPPITLRSVEDAIAFPHRVGDKPCKMCGKPTSAPVGLCGDCYL